MKFGIFGTNRVSIIEWCLYYRDFHTENFSYFKESANNSRLMIFTIDFIENHSWCPSYSCGTRVQKFLISGFFEFMFTLVMS